MKNALKMRLIILTSLCFLVVVPLKSSAARQRIAKDEAITIADKLIVKNGCSDQLPVSQRSRVTLENDLEMALKHEVLCKAYAVHEGRTSGRSGWTILFRLAHVCPECPIDNIWRAVTMDEYGQDVRLERGPFYSKANKKR